MTQKINHAAVWTSALVFQVLSILWYSPLLFANPWMNYLGKKFEDFHGESINGLMFSISGAIISNYFLAWLFIKLQRDNGTKGLSTACGIALACFAFETFTQDGFSLRPLGLSLINVGSVLLNFCAAGMLLGSWKKYQVA